MTNKASLVNKFRKFIPGAEGVAWICFAMLIFAFSLYISHLA